ncbi:MAG: hypothetical protein IPK39_23655 [Sulfuritalea sp.]|nr:hypothetical protein [Sulfuritalea sp.]
MPVATEIWQRPPGKTLFVWMDEQPVQGSYRITMPATPKRSAHEALLHVRFGSVTLKSRSIAPTNGRRLN